MKFFKIRAFCTVPHTEPVEGSENGIWTAPQVVELHFAHHRCMCGPVKY
jgi:hypothetical protein